MTSFSEISGKTALTALLLGAVAFAAEAQRTPSPSPGAQVKQTVGVTDLTVTYSRPMLRGRKAFGPDSTSVRKFGELWRTGANSATILELSTDAMVEGQTLPAGKYSLLSIPDPNAWTVIFNKKADASEQTYSQGDDALRVKVAPVMNGPKTDAFLVWFSDLTDSTATMNLAWDTALVPVKLAFNTSALAEKNVADAVAAKPDDANVLANAANYHLGKGKNLNQALEWVNKSIGIKENFRNVWTKAQILAKLGNFTEAVPLAQKALTLGAGDSIFPFFKGGIESSLKEWQTKLPALDAVKGKVMGKKKKS
jgi:hypothetical protein